MQSWDYDILRYVKYIIDYFSKRNSFAPLLRVKPTTVVIIITIINIIMMVLFSNQLVIVFGTFAQQRATKYETTLLNK